ncbi:MAG: hypothetical protein KAH48_08790, partial [Chlorobi bacterium]|nr:hypothetical protein [Chlorobiota bacterium]
NGNGTHDSWEPLLSGWTINLTNSGSTVNLTAVTDANGYYNFGGLVPDTYTISETNQSGWVQTQPATSSNWTITIAGDYEHHSANFGNRKDPPSTDCHIKIGSIDEDCCCYTFTMINPFGKSISKIELVTDDGILQSWNPNFSCDAGTHSPIPAPNVGWDFTTACDDDISWTVCFRSTTNHGVIITNWVIYFDDDTMCEHTETIKCEPATQLACDRISVKTIVNGKLPITNRRYRITNTKIPASDICQVVINYTPANYQGTSIPVPDVAGVVRVLSSPSASIQHLGMAINPPYTNLDLSSIISNPTDMPHTGGYVEFNIGLNYQRNWDGVVEILVIHCDGDTCTFTNKWKLKKPFISHDVVSVIRRAMSDSLFAVPLRIQAKTSSGNVGSISFYLDPDDDGDTVPTIFAISGAGHILDDADADNRTILRSAQGQSQARFEFNPPLVINKDMAPLELNLVLSHDGNIPDEIPIRWTMHGVDDDCDGIDDDCDGIDGGMITVTTTSVIEQIVNEDSEQISIVEAYPNPASTKTTIKYDL